jgi:Cytochrome P460
MKNQTFSIVLFLTVSICFTQSCKEEDKETEEDKALFEEITSINDYSYYKESDTILESSNESPHNSYFRVKFNSTAFNMLTDDGKLPVNSTFPEGSIIVKELFNTQDGELELYAVMKKSTENNAEKGWIWAEYKPDGTTFYSVSEKGGSCIGCHSINERDYVRLFDLFP